MKARELCFSAEELRALNWELFAIVRARVEAKGGDMSDLASTALSFASMSAAIQCARSSQEPKAYARKFGRFAQIIFLREIDGAQLLLSALETQQ